MAIKYLYLPLIVISIVFSFILFTENSKLSTELVTLSNRNKPLTYIDNSQKIKNKSEELVKREVLINNYFLEDLNIDKASEEIKVNLLINNIKIKQFSINNQSVFFTTSGSGADYSKFITTYLYKHKELHILNISVKEDISETGHLNLDLQIEIYNRKSSDNNQFIDEDFIDFTDVKLATSSNLFSNFNIKNIKKEIFKSDLIIKEREILKFNKFQYLGELKLENKELTIFKDKNSGRIYRFLKNQTISDWTYLGTSENGYLFKNKNQQYEVIN